MVKNVLSYFLALILFLFSISYNYTILLSRFNVENVLDNIEYLSSDQLKGRYSGTLENELTATYISDELKSLNISPLGENYYQKYEALLPSRIEGAPHLAIYDNNDKLVKEYKYGVDYKESLLNCKVSEVKLYKDSLSTSTSGFMSFAPSYNNNISLYKVDDDKLTFRSSFFADSQYDLLFPVSSNCFSDISNTLDNNNYLYIFNPYINTNCTLSNVVGVIKGTNSNMSPVVIGAHFDHMGTDLNNNVYGGALDNASGASFVLELARYIASLGTPDRDMVFVLFNGEEIGLTGSKAFVNEYKDYLKDSKVYNFDMIGSDDGVPLCLMGAARSSVNDSLIEEVSKVCKNKQIFFNYEFEDASDHASFINNGIDAISFCDEDMTRIHTPEDDISHISKSAIKRCFSVVKPELLKNIYPSNYLYAHCYIFLEVSFLLLIFFIIIIHRVNTSRSK